MSNRIRCVVGVDLGDRTSVVGGIDKKTGEVMAHRRVATEPVAMDEFFRSLPGRARVVLETGTHSPWVSRIAERHGHEVVVGQARKLRAIWQNDRKGDDADTDILWQIGDVRPELLSPIRHRGEEAQRDLALLRLREQAVDTRTKLVSAVRGTLKSFGYRAPKGAPEVFHERGAEGLPEEFAAAVLPMLAAIGQMTATIAAYDAEVRRLVREKYADETQRLLEVNGVGNLTALAYVLVLEDPRRFRRSRDVGAYLGLVPRRDQSGDSERQLPISKTGDRMMRRLLVQAAHHMLSPFGKDSDLRRWGRARLEHGGKTAKKKTVVAVARRVAVLLHRLWVDGKPYEPLRHAMRAEGASKAA